VVTRFEGPLLAFSSSDLLEDLLRHDQLDAEAPVSAVAAAADGTVAAGTTGGKVVIWDAQRNAPSLVLGGHRSQITTVEFFGTEDNRILTASSDGTTRIWDIGIGGDRELLTLRPAEWGVDTVAISGEGNVVAAGDERQGVFLYDVATAESLLTVQGERYWRLHEQPGRVLTNLVGEEVGLNHDGTMLATTASFSGSSVGIWDVSTQTLIVGQLGDMNCVTPESAAHPELIECDPTMVMGAIGEIQLQSATDVQVSPDGSQAVYTGLSGEEAVIVEMQSTDPQRVINIIGEGPIFDAAYAPDGSQLLLGDAEGLLLIDPHLDDRAGSFGPGTYTRQTPGGDDTPIRLAHPDGFTPETVAYAPHGTWVAAAWQEGGVAVFDIVSGELLLDADDIPVAVEIAFISGGSMLAVLVEDGRLLLLDGESGRLVVTISNHAAEGTDLAATPDGRLAATSSKDGTVRIYVMDEAELFDLARSRLSRSFSADECHRYLIEGDCTTR
jgi:WD40 repeat protein